MIFVKIKAKLHKTSALKYSKFCCWDPKWSSKI